MCDLLPEWLLPSFPACITTTAAGNPNILADQYIETNCISSDVSSTLLPESMEQVSILAVLYYSTGNSDDFGGPLRNAGWLRNGSCDPCGDSWGGVICSGERNDDGVDHIAGLNLAGDALTSNLDGTIPTLLGELTDLETLVLRKNDLYGQIPSELGYLNQLVELDLRGNELDGTIPSELGRAQSLENVFLQWNDITGIVPSEICDLSLSSLYVDCAEGSGSSIEGISQVQCECCTLCCSNNNFVNTCGNSGCDGYDSSIACCNGLTNICDLGVDEILFGTLHNAMAAQEDGFRLFPNHKYQLEDALNAGYRGINVDVCNCNGIIQLCHGLCGFADRNAREVFTNINTFLDGHRTEVIIIPIQIANGAGLPVDIRQLYGILSSIDGFVDKMYIHGNDNDADWPTLQTLIDTNRRILIFHYNGPNCSSNLETNPNYCPPGMHFWWDYAVETEYSFGSLQELRETDRSCRITRGAARTGTFFGVNDFVTLPTREYAQRANSFEFVQQRIQACSSFNNNKDVNLILVDFWDEGEVLEVVQSHNSALGAARRRAATRQR